MALNPLQTLQGITGTIKGAWDTAKSSLSGTPMGSTTTIPVEQNKPVGELKTGQNTIQLEANKKIQADLNKKYAGDTNYKPIAVDGIIGPQTKAAMSYKPISTAKPDYDTTTGLLTAEGKAKGLPEINAPAINKPGAAVNPLTGGATTTTGPDTTREGLLKTLTTKGTQPITGFTEKDKALQAITQQIADLDKAQADQITAIGQSQGTIEYKEGKKRILANQYLMQKNALTDQLNALTGQLGAWNTQQQTQTGAIQNALGQQQLTTVPYDVRVGTPSELLTGTEVGGGRYGTGVEATSNIQSIKDYTTQINDTESQAPAFTANLNNMASTMSGMNPQTPIEQGFIQLFGGTIENNPKVAAYRTQLAQIRAQYEKLTGADGYAAFPDNMTYEQFKQKIAEANAAIANNLNNLKRKRDELNRGAGTTSTNIGSTSSLSAFLTS